MFDRLSQMGTDQDDSPQFRQVAQRARHLQSAVAAGVPTHALLPIARDCFDHLVQSQQAWMQVSILWTPISTESVQNIVVIQVPSPKYYQS